MSRTNDNAGGVSARTKMMIGLMLLLFVALVVMRLNDGPERPPDVPDEELVKMLPKVEPREGYAGSDSCRDCHEHQHETWHHSWHRTMTQEAKLENVLGDFDDVTISNRLGQTVELFQRDGRAWFRMNYEPRLFIGHNPPRREFPIELLTGSHHMQIYWFPAGRARTLGMMPVVWLKEDQRWVPRQSVFLIPSGDEFGAEVGRWNETCLKCHTTNPEPNREVGGRGKAFDTHVSEFGISCEACHGPGAAHVAIHTAGSTNEVSQLVDRIVNPDGLTHELSAQVCGGCHSVNSVKDSKTEWREHKPGAVITETRHLDRLDREKLHEQMNEFGVTSYEGINEQYDNSFWLDGKVRISGREYSGMLETACHTKGTMSCVTCHSLHQSKSDRRPVKEWANDQLHPSRKGDLSCAGCHDTARYASVSHTHHLAGSSGASCINCHMPHTTYGLLKAIRSHSISSPSAMETVDVRRPNACNLCHLDQTLEWTARHLNDWFSQPVPDLSDEQKTVAEGALMALKRDAGIRALAAWHMSWKPAVAVSGGDDWMPPYLSVLLRDPYPAVRYIAGRSLRRFESHGEFAYDFVADRDRLQELSREAHALWRRDGSASARPVVLIGKSATLDERFQEFHADRDDRDVALIE